VVSQHRTIARWKAGKRGLAPGRLTTCGCCWLAAGMPGMLRGAARKIAVARIGLIGAPQLVSVESRRLRRTKARWRALGHLRCAVVDATVRLL
jgi:hypothetical protein